MKKTVQFVYFNGLAWYGAKLALTLLTNYMTDYNVIGRNVLSVTPATHQDVFLLSYLADREFHKSFKVLNDAKIPLYSRNRNDTHPIVIAGGAAMFQPEPIADLIDVICVGDGEEFLMNIQRCLQSPTRQARIDALGELPGAYIPARRKIIYDATGFGIKDIEGETKDIIPHVTELWLPPPILEGTRQQEIELARGCNMSCAFCSITWRQKFRVRDQSETMKELDLAQGDLAFFAPNTGGVSYYADIHKYRGKGSKGDVTVTDFLKLPYPEKDEYDGHSFTFGVEGITEDLRRIVGKPIKDQALYDIADRLHYGGAKRLQLYFIRNVPGETEEHWFRFNDWFLDYRDLLISYGIHTEFQFTPLTKQAHTPFQYFDHTYLDYAEKYVKTIEREHKARNARLKPLEKGHPDRINIFINQSRRKASWLIDNLTNMFGRNGLRFIYAQHNRVLASNKLKQDSYVGSGFDKVVNVANQCGLDVDFMLGELPLDHPFPWMFIKPYSTDKMAKMAKGIQRRIANDTG